MVNGGNRPTKRVHYKVQAKGRFEPIEVQISRQTRAIERHEGLIARHTAIQSWTNILTLVFSVITTCLLIYVANSQYEASERQVELEYAKVAPQFSVGMELFGTETSPAIENKVPSKLSIRLTRGEGVISRVEATQDFRVSILKIDSGDSSDSSCLVRTNNYFYFNDNYTDAVAAPSINRIAGDPAFFYPKLHDNFYIIAPEKTWVKIFYIDIFGKERSLIFSGSGNRLSQVPSNDLSRNSLYEIFDAKFLSRDSGKFPEFWERPKSNPETDGCRYILKESPLSAQT
jgi:hypothetical protein